MWAVKNINNIVIDIIGEKIFTVFGDEKVDIVYRFPHIYISSTNTRCTTATCLVDYYIADRFKSLL